MSSRRSSRLSESSAVSSSSSSSSSAPPPPESSVHTRTHRRGSKRSPEAAEEPKSEHPQEEVSSKRTRSENEEKKTVNQVNDEKQTIDDEEDDGVIEGEEEANLPISASTTTTPSLSSSSNTIVSDTLSSLIDAHGKISADTDWSSLSVTLGISEYELRRQANIRAKQAQLQALNLLGITQSMGLQPTPAAHSSTKKATTKRKRPSTTSEANEGMSTRSYSLRSNVRAPDYKPPTPIYTPELTNSNQKPDRKVGTLTFTETSLNQTSTCDDEEKAQDLATIQYFTQLLIHAEDEKQYQQATYPSVWSSGKPCLPTVGHQWRPLGESVKVLPSRVVVMTYHPTISSVTENKSIIAASDKLGHLAITAYESASSKTNFSAPWPTNSLSFQPHSSPIGELVWGGNAYLCDTLFTASRDGTIRSMNIEQQTFNELYVTKEEDDNGFYGLALDSTKNMLWSCDKEGHVITLDLRTKTYPLNKCTNRYVVSEKKVNSVSLNSLNEHLFVTASLDRTVSIWDQRSVKEPTGYFTHGFNVNSAYFSPDGTKLCSTSLDDTVKIWSCVNTQGALVLEANKWGPPTVIKHNNHTGRWISPFRAKWSPDSNAIAIGNMNRAIDIYMLHSSSSQPLPKTLSVPPPLASPVMSLTHSEIVTSIPAAVEWHPTLKHISGGTGSGRLVVLAPSAEALGLSSTKK